MNYFIVLIMILTSILIFSCSSQAFKQNGKQECHNKKVYNEKNGSFTTVDGCDYSYKFF